MALVAHSHLPAFERLRAEGYEVLSPEEARRQDIRELHIGLLNLMPDAALRATERQFFRLVGACNRIVQICIHPFTVGHESRGPEARAYLDEHYERFDDLRRAGLDALIVTGANPASDDLSREPFWEPLGEVLDWATEHVCSVLCSCLASHAVVQRRYGVERRRRAEKRWGVFRHRLVERSHPLVRQVDTRFDAPRSHRFEITPDQLAPVGCRILAVDDEGGLHLATSEDGFRLVFFQGHPEYDVESLLKEYKREIERFVGGVRQSFPPPPENYFSPAALRWVEDHRRAVVEALRAGAAPPALPEVELGPLLDNTWSDTGKAIFGNWLGWVYQLADGDRRRPCRSAELPAVFAPARARSGAL